jgi:hypothetical protein
MRICNISYIRNVSVEHALPITRTRLNGVSANYGTSAYDASQLGLGLFELDHFTTA